MYYAWHCFRQMKIACAVPIFTAGDKTIFSNYRPVSSFPCFPKFLERVVVSKLKNSSNIFLFSYKQCTFVLFLGDFLSSQFSVFTSHVIKTKKIVTIQWKKSRIWDTIDDWYQNNLAENQVFAVFYSRVICRSVLPKFIELLMGTQCMCPLEGHKHGGRKVT